MSTVTSPNMGLPVPVVGQEPGPQWATDLNNCMAVIDAHSHNPGSGVPITPASLNINADLPLNTNNITQSRTLRFTPQSATLSLASDIGCLYEVTNDLWYNDGAGNQVRLTQSGSIVGTAGSITGLPSGTAGASYSGVSSTFTFQSATSIAANLDLGSVTFRNLSPNSTFGVTVSPVAGLGNNYALTLPTLPISTRVLSLDSSGNFAAGVAGVVITADIGNQQITTPLIADANVTTAKIADANVTRPKLVAVGQQVSASTGALTLGATGGVATFAQVTNLSITLTTTGRPVVLCVQSDGTLGASNRGFEVFGDYVPGGAYPQLPALGAFFRGATRITASPLPMNTQNNETNWQTSGSPFFFIDTPAAGTYTYTFKYSAITNITTIFNNAVLMAYEL